MTATHQALEQRDRMFLAATRAMRAGMEAVDAVVRLAGRRRDVRGSGAAALHARHADSWAPQLRVLRWPEHAAEHVAGRRDHPTATGPPSGAPRARGGRDRRDERRPLRP